MSENLSELSARKGLEDNLFDRFGKLAVENGTISEEKLAALADEFLVGGANLYGATTFYDFLKPENKDKKVYICNGTACLCAGTQDDLHANLLRYFDPKEIGHMTCLGRCYENSAFHFGGKNYSGLESGNLDQVFQKEFSGPPADYTVRHQGNSILTRPFTNIEAYYQPLLSLLDKNKETALDQIKASELRGKRGSWVSDGF